MKKLKKKRGKRRKRRLKLSEIVPKLQCNNDKETSLMNFDSLLYDIYYSI